MEEFEKLQKLIRLKKYETPGEEFVDEFVARFRERQRQEMLKQPALALFWEQVKMYFSEAPGQKWALAAAGVALLALAAWLAIPRSQSGSDLAGRHPGETPVSVSLARDGTGKTIPGFSVDAIRIMSVEVEPDPGLLSKHFQNGYEQFVIVPRENSESTIAVPYELVRFEGKPDIR